MRLAFPWLSIVAMFSILNVSTLPLSNRGLGDAPHPHRVTHTHLAGFQVGHWGMNWGMKFNSLGSCSCWFFNLADSWPKSKVNEYRVWLLANLWIIKCLNSLDVRKVIHLCVVWYVHAFIYLFSFQLKLYILFFTLYVTKYTFPIRTKENTISI